MLSLVGKPGAWRILLPRNQDFPHTAITNHNGGFDVDENGPRPGADQARRHSQSREKLLIYKTLSYFQTIAELFCFLKHSLNLHPALKSAIYRVTAKRQPSVSGWIAAADRRTNPRQPAYRDHAAQRHKFHFISIRRRSAAQTAAKWRTAGLRHRAHTTGSFPAGEPADVAMNRPSTKSS